MAQVGSLYSYSSSSLGLSPMAELVKRRGSSWRKEEGAPGGRKRKFGVKEEDPLVNGRGATVKEKRELL